MNALPVRRTFGLLGLFLLSLYSPQPGVARLQDRPAVMVDLAGPGWRALNGNDFVNVNCKPETWNWKGSLLACTGQPTGVMRTRQIFTNFELMVEWRHLRSAGNSGVFLWVPEIALTNLQSDTLPKYGIEMQALDH
jgi:hypothetical protein